ncbi:MAG: hypothetical protein V7K24_02600 [Nostoc sp.]
MYLEILGLLRRKRSLPMFAEQFWDKGERSLFPNFSSKNSSLASLKKLPSLK